ncbi:hypothetical protein BMS3Abin02_00005 [bacterium BMS3Abin02]|nr:hypothetical protein BMS3Abin02_00005 [bacterium BMS3Abin02]
MSRGLAVAAMTLVLVGCGRTGHVRPLTDVTTSLVSVSAGQTPTTERSGPAVSVTGWAPPPVPIPKDPDYREKLGPYADMVLRGGAVPYGSEEHVLYIVSCIESAGFDVTVGPDGHSMEAAPGVQVDRFRQVQAACEQAAIDSGLVAPPQSPSEEQLALQYQALLITYRCLVEYGYPAPEPPSEQTYVDSGGSAWHPYTLLEGDVSAVEQICPQDLVTLYEQMAAAGQTP